MLSVLVQFFDGRENNINHFIFLKEEKKKDQTLFESVVSVHVLYLVLCSTYYNLSCIFIIFLIK